MQTGVFVDAEASAPTDRRGFPAPPCAGALGAERYTLVFVAEQWGRHPSSAQEIASRLPDEAEILWLETVDATRPRLDRATLRRGVEQIGRWMKAAATPTGIADRPFRMRVLSPLHWPRWNSPHVQRWNAARLAQAVASAPRSKGGRLVLVTTLPLAALLLDRIAFDRVVYYCVDDFTHWPGTDRHVQEALERRLLERCDVVFAASRSLQKRLRGLGQQACLLPHGVDAAQWRRANTNNASAAAALASLPRPLLLFWGSVDFRLDATWIQTCQRATGGSVVLIGPERGADRQLLRLPGVIRTGPVAKADLPAYAALSDVLIMPYVDLPVTRHMQPLKLLEYLNTDRPVVMRDLPACREWADAADVVGCIEELRDVLARRLRDGVPPSQLRARARARLCGWQQTVERFWQGVTGQTICEGGLPAAVD